MVRDVLQGAYAVHALDVAGPAIPFEPGVAEAAAAVVFRACRALVDREERPEELARSLALPRPPASPSDHLSADLTFRYLPGIYRRARGIDPGDSLVSSLAALMRLWPLSGVLADLDDGPDPPPDLTDHPGLMLLYAERFARLGGRRPSWRPSGRAAEFVDLVAGEAS